MKPSSRAALLKAQDALDNALNECLAEAIDASAPTRAKILAHIQSIPHFIEQIKMLVDPPKPEYGNAIPNFGYQQYNSLVSRDAEATKAPKEAW